MNDSRKQDSELTESEASCHCGRVKILVQTPFHIKASRCNCSICKKSGYLHLTVARNEMKLLQGEEFLSEYQFNTRTARHLFCKVCGVKVFYVPRSHPNSYSVNVNCLKLDERFQIDIRDFDGENWEDNVALLRARTE